MKKAYDFVFNSVSYFSLALWMFSFFFCILFIRECINVEPTINHPPPSAESCEKQAWFEIHHCIDESYLYKAPCLEAGAKLLNQCVNLKTEKIKKVYISNDIGPNKRPKSPKSNICEEEHYAN